MIGSYLRSFADGRIEEVATFDLDAVTGDDSKAAKLARVLASYAERLPAEERELLARLAVFPRGVSVELLGTLVDAGGEVAGLLARAKPRLFKLLGDLKARGLVFQYRSGASVTWTAHPFLRERFRKLIGCPAGHIFDVVARSLGAGLETRPATKPTDPTVLDRYEQLIEVTRLASRQQEAFDLYWFGLGAYVHLGKLLGEYRRGYRILKSFSATGRLKDLATSMVLRERSLLVNDLALFTLRLGRLREAWAIREVESEWARSLAEPEETSTRQRNAALVLLALGHLPRAQVLAEAALTKADAAEAGERDSSSPALRALVAHLAGDIGAARAFFAVAERLEGQPLYSGRGAALARHQLDLGDLGSARALCDHGLEVARANDWIDNLTWFNALLARLALTEGRDPTSHLEEIRAWTAHTGDMEYVIEAQLLSARHLLAIGDPQTALGEAEAGLLHAAACGYGLLQIELLVTLARTWLAWPDPPRAVQAAREALDLAAHPDCGYAWGEADAAQVWGEAYFANHEPTLAQRAFTRAFEVRRRIEHPGVSETEQWLARLG